MPLQDDPSGLTVGSTKVSEGGGAVVVNGGGLHAEFAWADYAKLELVLSL